MAANKVVYGTLVLMDLTSDTATAADVAKGKTFHDKTGAQVTGSLTENDALSVVTNSQTVEYFVTTVGGVNVPFIRMKAKIKPKTANKKTILNGEQSINIAKTAYDFGDATASDVAKGKTFTSRNGLAITGTLETSGSGESSAENKVYVITDPSNPAVGLSDGTVQIYGYAKDSKYLYSFCGNKYYRRNQSGRDSSLSTTFKAISGSITNLPSNLTECNLIAFRLS